MHSPQQQQPPQWQQPYQQAPTPPRRRMSPLKWSLIAAGIVVLLVAGLVLASTVAAKVAGSLPSASATPGKSAQPPATVPAYEVVKTRRNGVDLLVPKATVSSAKTVIRDWIKRNADDRDYLVVTVVRSADAKTYVCEGEYVADERTSKIKTGGRITADEYPTTAMNCPDPK
ncbi:hypothetical protein AB0F17_16080 [Nonomuraea sp. NPDC026600]|uniref:hypothetical protein n=1 Tax=Nonomuraea sp. NPDC026600 TaxID=3155363 RepID=UPI00340F246F